ncbi:SMI1/KNR4 family protein [Streptomyces sp. NPDC002962]|uniref:SMI1/KNR4 family protein n=1 Tax=Streptomyces sp. NPDC002962 TaxID=3364674 RepID=UPI0036C93606
MAHRPPAPRPGPRDQPRPLGDDDPLGNDRHHGPPAHPRLSRCARVLPRWPWKTPSVAASHHGYRLHAPLAEETIRHFEQLHSITLPATYRSFLSTVTGGGAGPDYGLLGLAEEVDEEEALHDLRAECLHVGFLASAFAHTTEWPGPGREGNADYSVAGTLVLGESGCGTFSRLVITGSNREIAP